ncbi:SUKH-4 family immunity protein [Streptomyces monomycini]|uniref:SUKH-4 family immunity protein n=1 Tax=Streptomyces monomycini TaxID=371720 RepID=UPI0004AB1239|nr:SUKH-4 family immunity protein [Streptomyces monomycini]
MTDGHDEEAHVTAADRVLETLSAFGRGSGVVRVAGPPGSGKSRVLELVRQEVPEAVTIDCAGLRADDVVLRMLDACGVQREHKAGTESLDVLVKRARGSHTVLLANVQRAGTLRTTDEPGRISRAVSRLGRARRAKVHVVMETAEPRGGAGSGTSPHLIRMESGISLPTPEEWPAEIRALTLGEIPVVPLDAWSVLCESMGVDGERSAPEALEALLPQHTGTLRWVPDDPATGGGVAFVHEGVARALRPSGPEAVAAHVRAAELLGERLASRPYPGGWAGGDALARYAAQAVPGHAAASGRLREMAEDRRLLTCLSPAAVMEAVRAAFGKDVPPDTVAADLCFVERFAMEPMRQSEWASWLHHFATARGDGAGADAVLASGVEMRWRTRWSDLRPMGVFHEGDADAVYGAGTLLRPSGISGLTATERTVRASSDDLESTWTWSLRSGQRQSEPDGAGDEASDSTVRPMVNTSRGWRPAPHTTGTAFMPRCPRDVSEGVRVGNLAVLGGRRGVFAVEFLSDDPAEDTAGETSPWYAAPLLDVYARSVAPRPLADAFRDPSAEFLAAVFGADCLLRPSESELPEGLRGTDAARWLVGRGMPLTEMLTLDTRRLRTEGIRELSGLEVSGLEVSDLEVSEQELPDQEAADSGRPGPYYRLGELLGGDLLLDGATGRVRCVSVNVEEQLAASSLPQFVALVCLMRWHRFMLSASLTEDEREARAELEAWLAGIDPAAAAGEVWDTLLNEPGLEP